MKRRGDPHAQHENDGEAADHRERHQRLFGAPNPSRVPGLSVVLKPQARGGVSAAQIGTIAGNNGGTQVTYHDHPLYYYVGDQKRGQAAGQGLDQFGGRWYVLSAQGLAVTSAASSTPAGGGTSSGAGSGYGY